MYIFKLVRFCSLLIKEINMNTTFRIYLSLFITFFSILIATRFCLDKEVWHQLLLFMFPITTCFLVWALKKYPFWYKSFIALCLAGISLLSWYDFSSVNLYITVPFLSGGVALLFSFYLEKNKNSVEKESKSLLK